MLGPELEKLIEEEILPYCKDIRCTKGMSYSGLEDKLGNFKRCAKLANTTPRIALFIYLCKHWDALSSFIRGEYSDSEAIKGRIADIINYMFLLVAILKEEGDLDVKTQREK
jgi:hypothetical protein